MSSVPNYKTQHEKPHLRDGLDGQFVSDSGAFAKTQSRSEMFLFPFSVLLECVSRTHSRFRQGREVAFLLASQSCFRFALPSVEHHFLTKGFNPSQTSYAAPLWSSKSAPVSQSKPLQLPVPGGLAHEFCFHVTTQLSVSAPETVAMPCAHFVYPTQAIRFVWMQK